MCKCEVFIFSVVIISNLILVHAFNIDIFNYARYRGQANSMFGFSVATHKDHGNNWIIVGAPEAQETRSSVHRGGVVYRCSTRSDDSCQEIPFQQAREGVEDTNVDNRTYQWFGATVSSGGIDKPVVACAPRYVWHTMDKDLREPVGTCYVAKNFQTFSDYSPCRTSLHGYHRQGSCQAGFSAGISKDGKRLFVGAPGSWYWQGQIYSIDPEIKFPFHPGSLFGETFGYGIEGQAFQQSLDNRPAVLSTPEGVASDDNTYMGYSMVLGDFKNEGVQGIAVGRPKAGLELEGQVLFYTWNLINFRNLTGLQIGGYFGYSLATSDIDGDGRDDIIIGAPMHTEKNTDNKYDVGRIYVAYQGQNALYEKMEFVDGFNSMSRFGLSVCSLGDMNLDGYGDFAVGAPYDGERGAVYIFQGGANGFIKKYTQVIYAKDVQQNIATLGNLTTFGFSLSGGIDLDGNDYPDMAVGAYLFNEAFFFRARPVVKANGYIKFLAYKKQISLDQEECISPHSGIKVACTDIEVCMQYKGVTVPDHIEMNLEFTFDSRKSKYTRMFLGDSTNKVVNKTLLLNKDDPLNCLKYKVYMDVNKKIIDKLTDLEIEVRYSLTQDESHSYQRNPNAILLPIVDLTMPAILNDTISIFKNCGDDNICIPDLNITIESKVDKYTYEIGKSLAFTIVITNSLEDSYGTVFYFELPKGIDYKGAMMADASQQKVTCLPTFNKTVYECEIGNPLPKGSVVRFILEFEPIRNELILSPTYVFVMNVTSANAEDKSTMKDNMVTVTVDVWVNAYIAIEKKSYPNEVYYNASQYSAAGAWDTEIGPSVIHLYTVTNKGPSDVEELELYIIWPYATSSGEDLLYLIEQPHVHGSVTCEPVDVNPRGYSLALQRNVWEIFDMSVPTTTPTPSPTVGPTGQPPGTETIETVVTFYDQSNNIVKEVIITGEGQKYWQELAKITNEYNTPYNIKTNTTIVTTYINKDGQKVTKKVQRRPTPAMPYTEYATYFDTYTNVTYFGAAGNLIYEEKTMAKPDSDEYRNKVNIAKKKYPDIVTVTYKQIKVVLFKTLDGKLLYSKEFDSPLQIPLKETTTSHNITTVTITDNNGVILDQKTITVIPDSKAYWELITEIIKRHNVPVYITTNTVKVITHYVNGEKTHEETVKISDTSPLSKPLKQIKTVVTLITYFDENRNERYHQTTSEEPDSPTFNAQVENVVQRLRGTTIVQTNTTITTEYQSPDGTSLHRTITKKFKEEWYNQKINPPQPPKPPQPPQPEPPSVAVTTISFYDADKKLLHSEEIQELPGTTTYWEHIVSFVRRIDIPVKISTTLNKVISHYEGSSVRYERVRLNSGIYEQPITMKIDINNVITYYKPDHSVIHTETIRGDFGEAQRQESYARLHGIYTGSFIVEVNSTRTISYISTFNNNVLYSDNIYKSLTQTVHQKIPQVQPQTSFLTTISFYDQQNRFVHKEEIRDSAGSTIYWDSIKRICQQHVQPLIIHTNSTRMITYFNERGEELNKEYRTATSGDYQRPITVNIDITTIVIYYREDGSEIRRETIKGAFGENERQERYNAFYRWYNRPFTMDITTTKKISFVNYSGQVISSDMVLVDRPTTQPEAIKSEITRTSFTVYGRDGQNMIYQQTIDIDPSSDAYKTFLVNLINRYSREGATIYTNSTKIITFHNSAGEERIVNVPGRSMRTNPLTSYGQNSAATTTITVYDPRGVQIHQDVLSGASGVDLQNKIQAITRITKQGDDIYNTGSDVSFISTPQVTNWQRSSTDFNNLNNEGRSYNQSYQFNQNSQFGNQGEFNFNGQDLGSFAKGQNGFTTGGFEWNPANRNADDNMRTHASQVFTTRNVQSWENQPHNTPTRTDNLQVRNKREVDTTSKDIEKLSDCKTSKCITIKCVSGPLRNRDEVHIALRARVNVQTLKNITTTKSVKIQSMILARISKFQNISGPPGQRDLYRQQAVTTIIAPETDLKADIVPLWVVVVSAVAGTLILLLLIFLLYKCGFFKRNRPSDAPERQPLNRNGHFQHGDEAL